MMKLEPNHRKNLRRYHTLLSCSWPRRIAITGGIGSGKSHVGNMLEAILTRRTIGKKKSIKKRFVMDSDEVVAQLTRENTTVIGRIAIAFPDCVTPDRFQPSGWKVDKVALQNRVFPNNQDNDQDMGRGDRCADSRYERANHDRVVLESIFHPAVLTRLLDDLRKARQARRALWFAEVPILFEAGWESLFHQTWLLLAPLRIRKRRVLSRTHMTSERFMEVCHRQIRPNDAKKKATYRLSTGANRDRLARKLRHDINLAMSN